MQTPQVNELKAYQMAYDLLKAGRFKCVAARGTASRWTHKDGSHLVMISSGDGMPTLTRIEERRI